MKAFLDDAKQSGQAIAGGGALDRTGCCIAPTIVRDLREGSRLVDEEPFGPVLSVVRYSDPADAARRASATPSGLGAERTEEGLNEFTQLPVIKR